MYERLRLGLKPKAMQLSYKGRPLVGAKVTLVPEFFLDGVVEPATGEALSDGTVGLQADGLDLPGVRVGYYRVVIDAPNAKLPAKYSSAETTTVGVEIPPISDDQRTYGNLQIALKD
jgi:hypothetical protein